MLKFYDDSTIGFSIFDAYPNLVCRMSTRSTVGTHQYNLVGMKQKHASNIKIVGGRTKKNIISDCDGLVTNEKNVFISVKASDCVPLFFYATDVHAVAVAHAGWRGTLENIACGVVNRLKLIGSHPKNIVVAVGPHIGGCCYDVDVGRYEKFLQVFGRDNGVVRIFEKKFFVDIGLANYIELICSGISPDHIDAPIACTSCQNDLYYSFRKDTKEMHSDMVGYIGIV